MGLFVEMEVRIGWTAEAGGNTMLGQAQANIPGQGQGNIPRIVFPAQVAQFIAGEPVPIAPGTVGSVTLANINTAMTACVADIAGATGTPFITPAALALIQGWAAGNP